MGSQKSDLDLMYRGVLLSGAAVWLVLGSALVSRAPARGQDGLATQGLEALATTGQAPNRESFALGDPAPQKPATLSSSPLLPTVTVERQGRLLVLTYGPTSAGGGLMSNAGPRGEPPGFTVYKGQRKIASGKFEYG